MNNFRNIQTWIYIPATKPNWFISPNIPAHTGIIIDLEGAVAETEKHIARKNAVEFLTDRNDQIEKEDENEIVAHQPIANNRIVAVRINQPQSDNGRQDLSALSELSSDVLRDILIVLPKVSDSNDIDLIKRVLPHVQVIAMIESPQGVINIASIVSHPMVKGIMMGAADLSSELHVSGDWASLLHVRQTLVLYGKAHKLPIWDSPYFDLKDISGLKEEATAAVECGFSGKVAIHPTQIEVIQQAYYPSSEQISWANRVLDAIAADTPTAVLDGKFVDKAMLDQAREILVRTHNKPPTMEKPHTVILSILSRFYKLRRKVIL